MRSRISSQCLIISRAGKRVVQNLVEAIAAKLFGDEVLHLVAMVGRSLVTQARLHMVAEFDIIVSVDAEDIFDDIHITLYIDAINRYFKAQSFFRLRGNLHLQAVDDALDRLSRDDFTRQRVDLLVRQVYLIGFEYFRINVLDGTGDGSASHLFDQEGGIFQDINRGIRIQSAFIPERSICVQSEAASCFADPSRMESGRFEEYVRCLLGYA